MEKGNGIVKFLEVHGGKFKMVGEIALTGVVLYYIFFEGRGTGPSSSAFGLGPKSLLNSTKDSFVF